MVQPKGVLKKEARIVRDEYIRSVKRTSAYFTNGWISRGEHMGVKRTDCIGEMLLVNEEYALGLETGFLKRKRGNVQALSLVIKRK